ncbi:rpsU-divergently transcribed protein [Roseivivax halodurans JCM 10272]|uniref:RpsU-divergently transcribed protein n=1 Tax=Roseivivax halodurans JCM 10272 TaxID=1449350 RepID=X7EGD6_9RHOB|nr:COQ9 family protein [Roseivivax halodurans]ETX14178.1 rpsU-divergently transcribed protein [Roseivivax halodurans JCM 10272]
MTEDPKDALIDAALMHVPFDGWSETTFRAAAEDAGVAPAVARGLFPRGAVDLALAFHARGDRRMVERLQSMSLDGLRYRDKVARAVRTRIEASEDREAVRRGMTLFSLPMYAADGTRALWNTADAIWTALGDTSEDFNWYTKRATLSGVYSSTVLYWLGDDSPGSHETWSFLDRRIDDVMRIETAKASVRKVPFMGKLMDLPNRFVGRRPKPRDDIPGQQRQ